MSKQPRPRLYWLLEKHEDSDVLSVTSDSDRSVAIAIAAMLDDRLKIAIQLSMTDHPRIAEPLFKGSGPLSSFSAKIDLGLLIGLYGLEIHRDLHLIRRIRNEFAHVRTPVDFLSDSISSRCLELKLPEIFNGVEGEIFRVDRWSEDCFKNSRIRFCRSAQIAHNLIVSSGTNARRPMEASVT